MKCVLLPEHRITSEQVRDICYKVYRDSDKLKRKVLLKDDFHIMGILYKIDSRFDFNYKIFKRKSILPLLQCCSKLKIKPYKLGIDIIQYGEFIDGFDYNVFISWCLKRDVDVEYWDDVVDILIAFQSYFNDIGNLGLPETEFKSNVSIKGVLELNDIHFDFFEDKKNIHAPKSGNTNMTLEDFDTDKNLNVELGYCGGMLKNPKYTWDYKLQTLKEIKL